MLRIMLMHLITVIFSMYFCLGFVDESCYEVLNILFITRMLFVSIMRLSAQGKACSLFNKTLKKGASCALFSV